MTPFGFVGSMHNHATDEMPDTQDRIAWRQIAAFVALVSRTGAASGAPTGEKFLGRNASRLVLSIL